MIDFRQAVTVLILHPTDNDKFLGVSRKTDHKDFGLPGGKVDPGETKEIAVRREVLEETGLTLGRVFEVFTDVCPGGNEDFLVTCYIADYPKYANATTDENIVVKWVTKEELLRGSFGDYNRKLFQHLGM